MELVPVYHFLTPKPSLLPSGNKRGVPSRTAGVTLARNGRGRLIQAHRLKALDESFQASHQRLDADVIQWCNSHGCPPDRLPYRFATEGIS